MIQYDYFNLYPLDGAYRSAESIVSQEEPVEQGLSLGELAQSLLDRYREMMDHQVTEKQMETALLPLRKAGYSQKLLSPDSKKHRETTLHSIEDFLYSMEDEDFSDTRWVFPQEKLYLIGVSEEDTEQELDASR